MNQGPSPRAVIVAPTSCHRNTRRVRASQVRRSRRPEIQNTRRPEAFRSKSSAGFVRMCRSREMTTRSRAATAGIQSVSRAPRGTSGMSGCPVWTTSVLAIASVFPSPREVSSTKYRSAAGFAVIRLCRVTAYDVPKKFVTQRRVHLMTAQVVEVHDHFRRISRPNLLCDYLCRDTPYDGFPELP